MGLSDKLKEIGLNDEEMKIVDGYTTNEDSTLFEVYSQATLNDNPSIANKIADTDIDMQNKYGWSLVHMAIRNDCMEAFDYLVEKGADLDVMDNVYWNPLMESIVDNKIEYGKKLVEQGVDITAVNDRGASAQALIQKFGRSDFFGLI
jgi:ankyrin repeat protein